MTKDIQASIAAIEKFVDEYVESYVLDDGECYYEPTEHEQFLIEDAINGLIADEQFTALVAGSVAAERDALRAEVERMRAAAQAVVNSSVPLDIWPGLHTRVSTDALAGLINVLMEFGQRAAREGK